MRFSAFLLVTFAACTTFTSASEPSAGGPKTKRWSEGNVLKLDLEVLDHSATDLSQTKLKLTATNTSATSIVLDRHLLAGLALRFTTDLTKEGLFDEDRDVDREELKKLDKPTPAETKRRFVRLKPGESLTRTYDLSKPMPEVEQGHATDLNMAHHGFYYEAEVRYKIPPRAKRLSVTAWFERSVWMMAEAQFTDWFGSSPRKLGLWDGRARSNTVIVEIHKSP